MQTININELPSEFLLLHDLYGAAFRNLRPQAPEDAIVYEVDAGELDDPNILLRAGRILPDGSMIGDPIDVVIAKVWLSEFRMDQAETPSP